MATTNELLTYGDVSAREDVVLNAVTILTATEQQLLNMVPKTNAINTVHIFLVDTLDTAASAAIAEDGDYSPNALTTPTRVTNIIEIVSKPFKVSRTQQDIQHYQGTDELSRQTEKAMKSYGNSAEFDFLRGTLTSGASGTAPVMSGLIQLSSRATNHTSHASGTTFAASILDALMKLAWDNSNGDVPTDLFVGSYLRTIIDGFTAKSNVVVNAPGIQTIIKTVMAYETSMGTLMIHKHRYIQDSGDATGRVFLMRPESAAAAYLKKPFIDTELARSGDYDVRAVTGKLTAEVRNYYSFMFADGFYKG